MSEPNPLGQSHAEYMKIIDETTRSTLDSLVKIRQSLAVVGRTLAILQDGLDAAEKLAASVRDGAGRG